MSEYPGRADMLCPPSNSRLAFTLLLLCPQRTDLPGRSEDKAPIAVDRSDIDLLNMQNPLFR
jgi:hypothetical protein